MKDSMFNHPALSLLFALSDKSAELDPLFNYLRSMPHISMAVNDSLPSDLSSYHVIVTDQAGSGAAASALSEFVRRGGGWLYLAHGKELSLPAIFGARLTEVEPAAELRIIFSDAGHPLARRMPDSFYCIGPHQSILPETDSIQVLMQADWHYRRTPVLIAGQADKGMVSCTSLRAYDDPNFRQILYRLLMFLSGGAGNPPFAGKSMGVGILGYPQSVGQLHGLGVSTTEGLHLTAACDLNSDRLRQAQIDFPDLKTYASADDLLRDPDVDVVIVATAPNTHAALALQMMSAGKHVVCEKPLALSRKETDAMLELSLNKGLHLSCHQNRRFDVDYRAIKGAVTEGIIGDLFYLETFVGGFSHPCGYWHSHEPVSGGAAYDWGGHYLDWIVGLIPERIKSVTGTAHKRVWHDVTNSDQERINVIFAGGQEAEFIHSDIAAVRKPKWYLLGTGGAIVSSWQDVTQFDIDPVLYFREQKIPATEMTPDLVAYRRHHSGDIVRQTLAMPRREHYLFHRNLADHLLTGEPLAAPLVDSIKVVAILEAAKQSALKGCSVEVADV